MSGAIAFIKGVLGLAAAAGVSAGQEASYAKRAAQTPGMNPSAETSALLRRVREERLKIHDGCPNCLGKRISEYPTGPYMHSQERNWLRAHLDAKGIPYNDEVLDEVSHVNWDRIRNQMLERDLRKARGWF